MEEELAAWLGASAQNRAARPALAAAAAEFKRSRSVSSSPTVLLSPVNTAHSQYAPDPPRTITI